MGMTSPRVLVAAGLYPPDIGGPATYAAMIEKELPLNGIAVTVLPYRSVRSLPKVFRHLVYTCKLWYAAGAADCIYALDPVSVGLPALIVSKLRRRPLLLRLGGDYAWEQGQQRFGITDTLDVYTAASQSAPWRVRLLQAIQSIVARQAKAVVVPSQYLARIVSTWGVKAERMHVIYSALTPLPTTMGKEMARRHFGWEGFVVVTAARLTPWKGVATLIDVVAGLQAGGVPALLIVAGDGKEREALETKVQQKELEPSVHFLGSLSKTELGNVLQAADAFILNTAYEGLSHQLLEVMASGVPIVTTDVGGNPELIHHKENGLLVAYNDEVALEHALASLARDQTEGERLAKNAAASLAKFSEAATLTSLISLINTYVRR